MGVRGLYSFLSNEPSRFGRQWSTNPNVDVEIYIDAPALHHHLIQCFQRRRNLPPFMNFSRLDHSPTGIVSPCILYKLTGAFLSHLLQATSTSENSRVHFVLDGMASEYKNDQQVERIQKYCTIFDQAAKSFVEGNSSGRSFHVPHLWGEAAMVEAAAAEAQKCDRLVLHFAEGEAETFIARNIEMTSASKKNGRHSVILSNDSDFLVFPSVPSFVPLHSLEYLENEDGYGSVLMGWEYTKSKLISAYPQMDCGNRNSGGEDNDRFLAMTTVAALAGCDYRLPAKFQRRITSARNIVVNSNIGGLRQRDRNCPSGRGTVLAVLRYISHFRNKNKNEWIKNAVQSIVSSEGTNAKTEDKKQKQQKEEDLMSALYMIQKIYRGTDTDTVRMQGVAFASDAVELKRLLLHRKLYCKPIMELCEVDSKGKQKQNGTRNISNEQYCVHQDRIGKGGSLWMNSSFVECRNRLYTYLARQHSPFTCSETKTDGDDSCIVTEYCRAGESNQASCRSFQVFVNLDGIDVETSLPREANFFHAVLHILSSKISKKDVGTSSQMNMIQESLEQLSPRFHSILFSSLLLDSKHDTMVLLLITLGPISTSKGFPEEMQEEYNFLVQRKEFMHTLGRIQLALQHTKLAIDAAKYFCDCIGTDHSLNLSSHDVFCDERLLVIWAIIMECDEDDIHMDEDCLEEVKSKVNRTFRTDDDMWGEQIDSIWRLWMKLRN